jgi:hypothetical protein
MTITKASTESANEEKECLVKSGKVSPLITRYNGWKSEGHVTLE